MVNNNTSIKSPVWLRTIYKCYEKDKREDLITGVYEKEELEVWVERATKENSENILRWKIEDNDCIEKGV